MPLPSEAVEARNQGIRGRGTPGQQGGPPGDLYVVVRVRPHPVFARNGDDFTVTAPVSFPEATLGAEIKVPTLGRPARGRL